MVGLIARYGLKIVIATAPSQEAAEEIALQLFLECGMDLKGIEVPMVIFNPMETGGMVIDPTDEDPFAIEDDYTMDGWTKDGFIGPS